MCKLWFIPNVTRVAYRKFFNFKLAINIGKTNLKCRQFSKKDIELRPKFYLSTLLKILLVTTSAKTQ